MSMSGRDGLPPEPRSPPPRVASSASDGDPQTIQDVSRTDSVFNLDEFLFRTSRTSSAASWNLMDFASRRVGSGSWGDTAAGSTGSLDDGAVRLMTPLKQWPSNSVTPAKHGPTEAQRIDTWIDNPLGACASPSGSPNGTAAGVAERGPPRNSRDLGSSSTFAVNPLLHDTHENDASTSEVSLTSKWVAPSEYVARRRAAGMRIRKTDLLLTRWASVNTPSVRNLSPSHVSPLEGFPCAEASVSQKVERRPPDDKGVPFFACTWKHLAMLSEGIGLYFRSLELLMWAVAGLVLASLFLLVNVFLARARNPGAFRGQPFGLADFTLRNIMVADAGDGERPRCCSGVADTRTLMLVSAVLDSAAMLAFVATLVGINWRRRTIERKMNNALTTVNDYTVWVKQGLPERGTTEGEIRGFFEERFGKVADVVIVNNIGALLTAIRDEAEARHQVEDAAALMAKNGEQWGASTYAKARKRKTVLSAKVEKLRQETKLVCRTAFVTFEHEQSYVEALLHYRYAHAFNWWHPWSALLRHLRLAKQPIRDRFRGQHRVVVEPAPEASDILWENLEVGVGWKVLRRCLTVVATAALLLATTGAVILVQDNAAIPTLELRCPSAELDAADLTPGLQGSLGTLVCSALWSLDDEDADRRQASRTAVKTYRGTVGPSECKDHLKEGLFTGNLTGLYLQVEADADYWAKLFMESWPGSSSSNQTSNTRVVTPDVIGDGDGDASPDGEDGRSDGGTDTSGTTSAVSVDMATLGAGADTRDVSDEFHGVHGLFYGLGSSGSLSDIGSSRAGLRVGHAGEDGSISESLSGLSSSDGVGKSGSDVGSGAGAGNSGDSRVKECAAMACYQCYCDLHFYSRYCHDYRLIYIESQWKHLFIVGVVAATDYLLMSAMGYLAHFERHSTISHLESSISIKVFFVLCISNALIPMLLQAWLPGINELGKYRDFSIDWYTRVGTQLQQMLLANMVLWPAREVLLMAGLLLQRVTLQWHCTTQRQLDELFEPPPFTLAVRNGQVMAFIAIGLSFSAALPLTPAFILAFLVLRSLSDKWMILRMCKKPVQYGPEVVRATLAWLPYIVLVHFCVGMWMFSNPLLDSGTISSKYNTADPKTLKEQIEMRICKVVAFPYILTLGITGVLLLVTNYVETARKSKQPIAAAEGNPPFSEAASVLVGLPSYRIMDNPNYRSWLLGEEGFIEQARKRSSSTS